MISCWKKLSPVLALTVLFAAPAFGQIRLAGTFRVVVQDSSRQPRANVRVTLGKQNAYTLRAIMRGNTSKDGILSFGKIPPGQYTLQLVDSVGETNTLQVEVVAKGGQAELTYAWPYIHWIPMNFISGTLMSGPTPLNRRNIVLRTFPGEAVVASAETDLRGVFDLAVSTPGRYVLDVSHVGPDGVRQNVGRIYIVVSLAGERKADHLFVEQTPSGLAYDRYCSLPPSELKDGCFHVSAPDGSSLTGAILNISRESGFSPTQTYTSNDQGIIQLPVLPSGSYAAQLYAKGTTPVRLSVQFGATSGACTAPLKISLNVIGSGCAPATPGKAN